MQSDGELEQGLAALAPPLEPFDFLEIEAIAARLRQLPAPSERAQAYLEQHLPRLARTLALIPLPVSTSRILELGCYLQITPFLQRLRGYQEVRGAYFGQLGRMIRKSIALPDGVFTCLIHQFDAESDRFPYPDEHFETVVAGEIIEHFLHDPMHMLLEARRVLVEGGRIVITTPNIASAASVAKALTGSGNPQIHSKYKQPAAGEELEVGHMREYTMQELGEAMKCAGFEVEALFTTFITEWAGHLPVLNLLKKAGFGTENRGEQTYAVGVKRGSLPVERYPAFLYE